jgi:hypothetical protein
MKEYEEIMRRKGLPNVGQLVRSKKYNTIWRIMEKRETWRSLGEDPVTKSPGGITPFISPSGRFSWEWSRGWEKPWGFSMAWLTIPLRRIG